VHATRTIDRADRRGREIGGLRPGLLMLALLFSGTTQREILSWTTVETGQKPPAPYAIRASDPQRTAVGLVYTPEVLAALIGDRAPASVDPRIAEAVRQQTPIVVMWGAPTPMPPEIPTPPRPATILISDFTNPSSPVRFEPLWLDHDAKLLSVFDERVRASEVRAVGAFVRAAFAPGRDICLYYEHRPEKNRDRSQSRCGKME
jgi:hypothetical protein